jgi:hypothetical protein
MAASVYSRALQKAAELVGGREQLSRRLQVPLADVETWIADKSKPSREVFLRIVDVLLDESSAAGEAGERETAPERDAAGARRYLD